MEWAIFQEWAERRRGREQGGRIAELNHVGNWISYKNATLAVSLSFIHLQQPLRPTPTPHRHLCAGNSAPEPVIPEIRL